MQNLDRLLVSSPDRNPPLHTWLHHPPRTQKSRRPTHPPHTRLPNEDPPRCSTLVYRQYNTVYRGTWPSKRILSASIGISGPPPLREDRGDGVHEGQTSKAIRTPRGFSGLMEMRARRIRSERRKSKKSWAPPPSCSRTALFSPSSRLGLFF